MPAISLRGIAILGIVLRVAIAPFLAHPYDGYVLFRLGEEAASKSPLQVNYFSPLLLDYLVPITLIYRQLPTAQGLILIPPEINPYPQFGLPGVTDPTFNLIVKVVPILCDLALMAVVYRLAWLASGKQEAGRRAATLWFLNPFSIWMTAAWGAYDSIPTFLTLISTLALVSRRPAASGLLLALAAGWKLYPLLLMPTFLVYGVRSLSLRSFMRFAIAFGASSAIIFLPATHQVLGAVLFATLEPAGRLGFGLTYWSVLLAVQAPSTLVIPGALVLFVIVMITALAMILRLQVRREACWLLSAQFLVLAALLLSLRIVPEPFFFWILPLWTILACLGRIEVSPLYGATAFALAYALVNLPFPFYLLSSYPFTGQMITDAVGFLGVRTAEAGVYQPHLSLASASLATLGFGFSSCLALSLADLFSRRHYVDMSIRKLARLLRPK